MTKISCFKLCCSLLLVLYSFGSVLGQYASDYEEYDFIPEFPDHYCGAKLDKTLDEVCKGQFAHKISYPPEKETETKPELVPTTTKPQWNLSTSLQKLFLLMGLQPLKLMDEPRRYRHKQVRYIGIYDECCLRPCTKMTLREYCLY